MKLPFDLSRAALQFADQASAGTLAGARDLLTGSMQWTAAQLEELSRIAPRELPERLSRSLKDAADGLRDAGDGTGDALSAAIEATAAAFESAHSAVHIADDITRRTLFENLQVSSVVGESFAGLVPTSKIQPAFRLITNGAGVDVSADAVAADYRMFREIRDAQPGVVLCVPGLFCDEGLWEDSGFNALLRDAGLYPIYMRFNPGAHISVNGRALLAMLRELLALPEFSELRPDVLSYSQGGLIVRSMLYYDGAENRNHADAPEEPARIEAGPIAERIGRCISINSPDGGSYLEKIGYWLGIGMEIVPLISLKAVGFIGNQRSDAIKDLSHGIIRESDWRTPYHTERYGRDFYFGELDAIDAYQIYSLISESDGPWESWLGDGIVETISLTRLTDQVYRAKSGPVDRVYCLFGKSHFQVVQDPETHAIVREVLRRS